MEEVGRAAVLRLLRVHCYAPGSDAAATAQRRWLGWVDVDGLLAGVPDPGTAADPPPHEGLEVALVGRLSAHKDPLTLLEAVAQARRAGARVRAHVVGDGPLAPQVRERAAEHDLSGSVVLHGHLADPLPVVGACDLLVLVSTAEGCPVVVMEAAALGRPSLVRAGLEGVSEILPAAHLTVARDSGPMQFASALKSLEQRKGHLRELGAAARRCYERTFSESAATARYLRLYEGLAR